MSDTELNFEDLLERYWGIAYNEGKTGILNGTEAGEVLHELRKFNTRTNAKEEPKDREIAKFVNDLTETARIFGQTQQLRDRFSRKVNRFIDIHKIVNVGTPGHIDWGNNRLKEELIEKNNALEECLSILKENNWRGDLQEEITELLRS